MDYSSCKANFNLQNPSGLSFTRSAYYDPYSSPSHSIGVSQRQSKNPSLGLGSGEKKSCMCSPTTRPGSFRCSLHKQSTGTRSLKTVSNNSHRLNVRRSAMTNSLVKIGKVERDLVKRTLAALIRSSSNQRRRRCDFRQRATRLSIMSNA